jgi:hypothetical protein
LEGLAAEDVGIFVYMWPLGFLDIWYILWSSGIFYSHLLCCTYKEKSGNPEFFFTKQLVTLA